MEERVVAPDMLNFSTLELEEFCRSENESNCLGDLLKALFSQAIADHQKLGEFQISAALSYLQVNLIGMLLDTFRTQKRPEELQSEDGRVGRHLWERIMNRSTREKQKRKVWETWEKLFHEIFDQVNVTQRSRSNGLACAILLGRVYQTPYCFMRNAIIIGNFSERFTLVNTMKNSRPLSNGYFPVRV